MTLSNLTVSTASMYSMKGLSQAFRKSLLDGPTIILVISHSGSHLEYSQQYTAAEGIVHSDRRRQMLEQIESNNSSFKIEMPQQAFAAASPDFRRWLGANSHATETTLHLGPLLPGYAMCVLDWLVRVLQHKDWHDFAITDASIEGVDKWYWVYSYAAMRRLGMTESAECLQAFVQHLISAHDTVRYYDDYFHLLRILNSSDPLLIKLAQQTAQQLVAGSTSLSAIECSQLASFYPQFGRAVNTHFAQPIVKDTTNCASGCNPMEIIVNGVQNMGVNQS